MQEGESTFCFGYVNYIKSLKVSLRVFLLPSKVFRVSSKIEVLKYWQGTRLSCLTGTSLPELCNFVCTYFTVLKLKL